MNGKRVGNLTGRYGKENDWINVLTISFISDSVCLKVSGARGQEEEIYPFRQCGVALNFPVYPGYQPYRPWVSKMREEGYVTAD